MTFVLVDAENVRRSTWPNVTAEDLVERCRGWAGREGVELVVVFDGRAPSMRVDEQIEVVGSGEESADDWIARRAAELTDDGTPYWLVTSDRELRARAGAGTERVIGGGSFLRGLT